MKIISYIFLLLIATSLLAIEVDFNFDDYSVSNARSLNENYSYPEKPGSPAIPFESKMLVIPFGNSLESIEFTTESTTFDITFELPTIPANAPFADGFISYPRNDTIYNSDQFYPSKPYEIQGIHRKNGVDVLVLRTFPYQYNPVTNKLTLVKSLNLTLNLKYDEDIAFEQAKMLLSNQKLSYALSNLDIDNPELIRSYFNQQSNVRDGRPSLVSSADPYQYIIITNNAFALEWSGFIAHKASLGVDLNVYTVEDIYANYTGRDNAEKVRNFIIDAYTTWSATDTPLEYVLMGGDHQQVPARYTKVAAYYNGAWHLSSVISDHYYSCLDGDWDNDADNLFGEGDHSIDSQADGMAGDEVDFFQELSIGRASCDSEVYLQNWINKTLSYENSIIEASYLKQAGLVGEYLGGGVWGGDYMDEISTFSPSFYQTKLYAHTNSYSTTNVISLINSGVNFVSHVGHGSSVKVFNMYEDDVDTLLTNTDYSFIYTQACNTLNFAYSNAIGEAFIKYEHGASAYIGNTNYGFYSYFLNQGPSQYLNREFFDAITNEGIEELGRANGDSREDIIALIGATGSMRQVSMEITLMGDPMLTLHSDVATLTAEQTLSDEVTLHLSDFTPDATAYTATYTLYEKDDVTNTIAVNSINVVGDDIILTLSGDIPEGIPFNIDISNMTGVSGVLTREIDMISNIRELSVITDEIWSPADNPHYIYKYLIIRNSLHLEPGVELRINEGAGLFIYGGGVLDAQGTIDNPILMTSYNPDTDNDWVDVTFNRDASPTGNILSNVIIQNANSGVWIDSTAVVDIENCYIFDTPEYAIHSYYGNETITNTVIAYSPASPATQAIYLEGCDTLFDNLTLVGNNLAEIELIDSDAVIRNSIIRGMNGNINSTGSTLTIDYTNFEGGYTGTGNIVVGPQFTDSANRDYTLENTSPCIDAGYQYTSLDPDNTLPDMGAIYYDHPIAFEAQFTHGDAPVSIEFTNNSGGSPTLIQWDFNNDGIWDNISDNHAYSFDASGIYDVTLRLEKGAWSDTLIKNNYIVITDDELLNAVNSSITIEETGVHLQWAASIEADYYLVYYNTRPDTEFQFLGFTETNEFYTNNSDPKAFYIIKKVIIND
ncbi:MAG: C25 family cysteine peptidase [Candidatus Zophobacter franzmannii]|nr:C25 family cysteine peptidase [Candidatus Zophobacter franzmannii]